MDGSAIIQAIAGDDNLTTTSLTTEKEDLEDTMAVGLAMDMCHHQLIFDVARLAT